MALNSETKRKKCQKNVRSSPSGILKAVPDHFQKKNFLHLNPDDKFDDKAIIGKIFQVNPVGKRVNGYIRKLVVTDGLEEPKDEQKKLTIFLLDKFAEDSNAAEIEGYIIIANFSVEKSTHHKENEFPFQVLVKKEDSLVWFARKVATSQSKTQNKTKKVKKKKNNIDNIVADGNQSEPVILSNHYVYTQLGDLHETELKETCNVYGIVEKCDLKVTQGRKTQVLDLVLTDKTETGFICSVYSSKDETFPDIYPGDIIRIHRMMVYKFRSKLRGKCLSSKFILVFSKSNNGSKPRTIAKSFTLTPEDTMMVKDLFEWYDKKNQPKLISEIERGDFVNIVCQVIGVYIAKNTDAVILKIWDGTKSNQIEGRHLGLRDEKLDEKIFNIAKNYYINLSVYGQHGSIAGELKPGQFIEVLDAHLYSPKDNPDDCKLCLHAGNKDKRGIQVLNLDDDKLAELKERLGNIAVDAQELGDQTEDMLNENNSIFLNCDISVVQSSQKSSRNDEEANNTDILNRPFPMREEAVMSSQDLNGITQREYSRIDFVEENEYSTTVEPDPMVMRTPLNIPEFQNNLSNQVDSSHIPSAISDTPEDWWMSLPTVSVTDGHSDVKPYSLAEIIEHEAPYKFRCFCVVLSYKPNIKSPLQLIHLYCPICMYMTEDFQPSIEPFLEQDGLFYFHCPNCSAEAENNKIVLEYTYVICFDLHDGTGKTNIEAYIYGKSAVKLFKGITPEQVIKDSNVANCVLYMLWNICPNCKPFSSKEAANQDSGAYPILDCCIMSYKIYDQTFYQIFDTKLL